MLAHSPIVTIAAVLFVMMPGCSRSSPPSPAEETLRSAVTAVNIAPSTEASTQPVPVALEANLPLPQGLAAGGAPPAVTGIDLPSVPFANQPRPPAKGQAEKRAEELDLRVPSKLELGPRILAEDHVVPPTKTFTPDAPELSRREASRLSLPQLPAGSKRYSAGRNPEEAFLPALSYPELEGVTPLADPGQTYARSVTQAPTAIGRGGFAAAIPLLPADPEENLRVFRLKEQPAEADVPARGRESIVLPAEKEKK